MGSIKLGNDGSVPSRGKRFFSSPKSPDQPPIEWISGALCLRMK